MPLTAPTVHGLGKQRQVTQVWGSLLSLCGIQVRGFSLDHPNCCAILRISFSQSTLSVFQINKTHHFFKAQNQILSPSYFIFSPGTQLRDISLWNLLCHFVRLIHKISHKPSSVFCCHECVYARWGRSHIRRTAEPQAHKVSEYCTAHLAYLKHLKTLSLITTKERSHFK